MTTLVTGATGNTGRHVVAELVRRGEHVRALTRDPGAAAGRFPEEVELVAGTHTAPGTLGDALEGVDRLHITVTAGLAEVGPDLVRRAVDAGVRRITVLWGGFVGPVEQAVADSGVEWTRLEPQEFMSNTLTWVESIRAEGVVREPYDIPGAVVHEADIAAVAAVALLDGGHSGALTTSPAPSRSPLESGSRSCPARSGGTSTSSRSRTSRPSTGWSPPACRAPTPNSSSGGTPPPAPRP
ncbi:hypothetical protein BJF90_26125 [Pseudonocardia sp. CNS-004]|nr:hypothetical protein BJF90_26125 [Pseudonocardia sp. CNS-004]